MTTNKVAIFGTSGFAKEVADICDAIGYSEIIFLTNSDDVSSIDGLKVVSESQINNLKQENYHFAIGIGDGYIRKKIREQYSSLVFPNLIHPSATFGRNQLARFNDNAGNIIAAGVRFTTNISVGDFCVFNLNSTIGHDCEISSYVSIMPSVNVSGNVIVEKLCMIGVGATILEGNSSQKIKLGQGSVIGAKSLVRKDVVENATYFGIPAKKIR